MELPAVWERLLSALPQGGIREQDVEIWLKPCRPLGMSGRTLQIEAPNGYFADWIQDNYLDALTEASVHVFGSGMEVRLVSRGGPPPIEVDGEEDLPAAGAGLNPAQTFDRFVVGHCNELAHAACQAVSSGPAKGYNPLYIYGATGLGKTHLLHAIGNAVIANDRRARVVYVTLEAFMNEMIEAITDKRMEDFRGKYRKRADVLLIDDIQFLSGRDRTQEEFFHTFNALQSAGRQIVLTSDVTPKEIDKLMPRLRTRFEGGLLADMQAPDRETLHAILNKKAIELNLTLPADLCDEIAGLVQGNIRELEGVLSRLASMHSFYKKPITLEVARQRLPDIFAPKSPAVTVPTIVEAVARLHNIRSADIMGIKRTLALTKPRQIAMFLARRHTKLSFPELGREFNRDHSTIQHGCTKIEGELKDDANLEYTVALIERNLGVRGRR